MRHLILVALMFMGTANAETPPAEQALESGSVELIVDSTGNGTVIARSCETCPQQATVDAETIFKAKNKTITAAQAKTHSGKAGTLVFETASRRAVLIQYW